MKRKEDSSRNYGWKKRGRKLEAAHGLRGESEVSGAANGKRRETRGYSAQSKVVAWRIQTQGCKVAQQVRKDPGAEDVLDREGDHDGQTKHLRRRKFTKNNGVSVQQIRY